MPGSFKPLLLALACLVALPATAGDRDSFLDERPGIGEPLRFRDAEGGAFRPRGLILIGPFGALAAEMPSGARTTRSEDRVDLSSTPLVGQLFRETLDVASVREGSLVGPVYRVADTLVVDATRTAPEEAPELARRHVALSTNVPRIGAVSYHLGRLGWTPVAAPAPEGVPIGSAHLVDGALVLASQGGEPAWPSVEAMFRDLFGTSR
jgi:hypothetical protein